MRRRLVAKFMSWPHVGSHLASWPRQSPRIACQPLNRALSATPSPFQAMNDAMSGMMERPKHVGYGVASGLKCIAGGVVAGAVGLVAMPVMGAKEDGAKGARQPQHIRARVLASATGASRLPAPLPAPLPMHAR